MADLIPPLRDLVFSRNTYDLPPGFAERFVKGHGEHWGRAEDHWERVVATVLNTDAVDEYASGRQAMQQAVFASGILLEKMGDACPICRRRKNRNGREGHHD